MLIIMTVLVEIGAIRVVDSIADLTKNLYRHPFAVSNALLKADLDIIAMHRYMKDVALAQNTEELELAVSLVDRAESDAFEHFDFVMTRFLGDKTRIERIRRLFADWKPIRTEVIVLTRLGRNGEAAMITKGKGAMYVATLTKEMESLIEFAHNKADEFVSQTIDQQHKSRIILYGLMAIVLVIGLLISYLVIRRLNKSSEELRESEERYRSISVSSSIAMVVAVDQHATIVSWNPAAERIFGYKEAEFVIDR